MTPAPNHFRKAAQELAIRGYRILPCAPREKRPLTKHGCKDATDDLEQIERWWTENPDANVAVATGGGLLVIDPDRRNGGDKTLETLEVAFGPLPRDCVAKTSDGTHIWLRYDGPKPPTHKSWPGVDFKHDDGYVVVAPSVHPSGFIYSFETFGEPAPLPAAWIAAMLTPDAPSRDEMSEDSIYQKCKDAVLALPDCVSGNCGHNQILRAACEIARWGVPAATAHAILRKYNETKCFDKDGNPYPWDEADLKRKLKEGHRKALKNGEIGERLREFKDAADLSEFEVVAECVDPDFLAGNGYVPLPMASFPDAIADYVTPVADAIGCDPSYIALPLLTCLSPAVGNSRVALVKSGWVEQPIVWTVLIAPSGSHKTPGFRAATRSLRQINAAYQVEYENACRLQAAAKHAYDRAKPGDAEDLPPIPRAPVWKQCVFSNATTEAIAEAFSMQEDRRGGAILSNELAAWLANMDRYSGSKGGDRAAWLECFDAERWEINRKTGDKKRISVRRAAGAITGGLQPETARLLFSADNIGSGLPARFLMAAPTPRTITWNENEVDPCVTAKLDYVFDRLFTLEAQLDDNLERTVPLGMPFTPDAKELWIERYNSHRAQMRDLDDTLTAVWAKLEAYTARLALIFELCDWAIGKGSDTEISRLNLERAIVLVDWFGNEAKRCYSLFGAKKIDHSSLVEWIREKGGSVLPRDVITYGPKQYRNAEARDKAFKDLIASGVGCRGEFDRSKSGPPVQPFILK